MFNTIPNNPFPPSTAQMNSGDNAEIQSQIDAINDVIAHEFDAEAGIYSVGDLVMYEGKLYEFTTAHETAGDWNSEEVTEKTVSDEVNTLRSGLTNVSSDLSTIAQTVSGLSNIKVLKLVTRDNAQIKHVKMNGRGAGLLIVEQNQRDSSVYAVTVSASGTATFTKLAGYAITIDSTTSSDVTIDLNSWSLLLILSTTNSWEEITS